MRVAYEPTDSPLGAKAVVCERPSVVVQFRPEPDEGQFMSDQCRPLLTRGSLDGGVGNLLALVLSLNVPLKPAIDS